jgi:Flp pilus assembly protein TadD
MTTPFARLIVALALAFGSHGGFAADTAPAPVADKLAPARAQIAAQQWALAIDELKRVNDVRNPDWNNLMGYSLRKGKTPDLAGAERFYNEALRLNPSHRGALEYSGELYLMKGDLATAEKRLAALEKACAKACDEHGELQRAIERFKANGNKYVAASSSGW